jgi:hypothetical protein
MSDSDAPVELGISPGLFAFSGQSELDPWTWTEAIEQMGWKRYELVHSHGYELGLQRIRDLVRKFPTWQHRNTFGRPQTDERAVLLGLLLRQYTRGTFRQIESFLRGRMQFFRLTHVPDASTLSLKNRSRRFSYLLQRFFEFVLERLPRRNVIVATDATGFGTEKRTWRDTPYPYRTKRKEWVKANCTVEIPQMLILSFDLSPGRRSEALTMGKAWSRLPSNVKPYRSLADSAYSGQDCVEVALAHGATPFHAFPQNAKHWAVPIGEREKMVNFGTHWPNRARKLRARRALIEALFAKVKDLLGERLRCKRWVARCNEVIAKFAVYNLRTILLREIMAGSSVTS